MSGDRAAVGDRDAAREGDPARDRDATGRARNARPRDALGRPLPRGASGVPTTPDELVLTPEAALAEAQQLLDAGRPFHAHEVLEGAWKRAPEDERDLWQALAQLAVGLTHAARGNPRGADRLLARASERLAPFAADAPYDIDVTGLRAWADAASGDDGNDLPTPRLRRTL